jgi:hypothetical protein
MSDVGADRVEADAMRAAIAGMSLNQSSFAALMSGLGDGREFRTILRSIQRMASADARVSGEMQVILSLLARDRARARRLAGALDWKPDDRGGFAAEVQGVRISVSPQRGDRWSVHARHVAEGPDGYSPSFPHWRDSLEEAKIRAVLAIDETLDQVEQIRSDAANKE